MNIALIGLGMVAGNPSLMEKLIDHNISAAVQND
jgi:hypothetical protein|tara:strand:- start:665 stop:766 length:102 start_codon:yes stop_codon:yes gene_type:complete